MKPKVNQLQQCADGNFGFDDDDHDDEDHKVKKGMKPPMNYPASVSNTAMLLDKSSGKPKASLMGVLGEMKFTESFSTHFAIQKNKQRGNNHCV